MNWYFICLASLLTLISCSDFNGSQEVSYRREPTNHTRIRCSEVTLGTIRTGLQTFARAYDLEYRERENNKSGSAFVVIMENDQHQFWVVPAEPDILMSEYLSESASNVRSTRQEFEALARVLATCGA